MDPALAPRWDEFVKAHPDGTAYHLSAWAQILRKAYRFRPAYLALAGDGGELRGVLPLVHGNGLVSKPRLISLPVVRWGGPLGRTTADEVALLRATLELADETGGRQVGIRSLRAGYEELVPELRVQGALPSWRISLPDSFDAFREDLRERSKNVFRSLKKAESASGLMVTEAKSERDLRRFYRLYLRTMRSHRSLPRSYRQMSVSRQLLQPAGIFKLLLVEHDGRAVAGGLFHFLGSTAELMYNASDARYLDLRPNHALFGWAIQRAIESGARHFDLGAAAPDTSLASFKARWGAEPVERFRYSLGAEGRSASEQAIRTTMRTAQSGESRLRKAWGRAPLALTRAAGTIAYKYL